MADTDLKLFYRRVVLHALYNKDKLVKGDLENLSGKIHWIQLEHPQSLREAEVFLA